MPDHQTITAESHMRLDLVLVQHWPHLGRKTVRRMIQNNAVAVNAQPAMKAGQYVDPGDTIDVDLPVVEKKKANTNYTARPLQVAYQDKQILIVDKPAGMSMHGSKQNPENAVVKQLAHVQPGIMHIGGVEHSGLIKRVETEASGLVLVAKDAQTYRALRKLVKRQRVQQIYSVLVEGHLRGEYTIDMPIGNVKRARERLMVAREGRPARTYYRAQRHYKEGGQDYTLLEVRPETSRLHQIRVHLSWYGFPLVGDRVYGSRRQPILADRIFLHLSVLEFPHPVTDEAIRAESPLPPELYSVLSYMARPKW